MSWRKSVIEVALGKRPADLVIVGGQLVNVNTREVYPADVAMVDGRIAVIGDVSQCTGPETEVVDAAGSYLVPGLIDSHLHTEDSQVTLTELSKVLLPRGVTTVMYAYEIANVLGVRGTDLIRQESKQIPLKVFFEAPTSVPWSPGLDTTGTTLSVDDVVEMLEWKETVSLGESDVFDVLAMDKDILAKVEAAHALGKPVNGHGPMLPPDQQMAVAAGAFTDDHENYTPDETLAKARLGLKVLLREFNMPFLAPAIAAANIDTRHMLLAIDDKPLHWLAKQGGVDAALRAAIAGGIDPVAAIQMGSINAAEHFRVDHELGSISLGRLGDIIVTDSLAELPARVVVANGRVVARDGQMVIDLPPFHYPEWAKGTVRLPRPMAAEDFEIFPGIEEGEAELRTFVLQEHGFVRLFEPRKFPVRGGKVVLEPGGPYCHIAVVDRFSGKGGVTHGIVEGFGLHQGAMAGTVGHDSHQITVIGANTADMAACANKLAETGGGYVAILNGEVAGLVELEVAGLFTEAPYGEVIEKLERFEDALRTRLGFPEDMMFLMITAFVFDGSPFQTAITDRGLVDVYSRTLLPLVISTNPAPAGEALAAA